MCDKAEQDPEATVLTSNPASETDERQSSYPEPVDTLGSSPVASERTNSPNTGSSCNSASSSNPSAVSEKPQFYIEVDASSMVNLKAGTQYTLVPLDSDQATAAAIPTSGSIAQTLAWGRTLDGRLPGEEPTGNPRVVSKEELTSDAFGLDQGMMSSFDGPTVAAGKTEEPDTTLDGEFEGSEDKMTYTPLMTVSQQQQQQQQQQPQTHDATAAAAAAAQMCSVKKTVVKTVATRSPCVRACAQQHVTSGYDAAALRYRHPTSPVYVAPPQHTLQHQTATPFLVHPRASWAPFTGTSTPQVWNRRRLVRTCTIHVTPLQGCPLCPHQVTCCWRTDCGYPGGANISSPCEALQTRAYLPMTSAGHSGTAAGAAAGLAGGASSSSATATAADSGLHATLGADEVTSAGDFSRGAAGDAAGGDIMGGVTTRVANMGQIQHMVGPLDNVPYYMPFNGRENHNEKERKRRTRIKNACQTLRSLVPGLSEKTDKATVFEFTVQYLLHLRRHLGTKHDKSISQEFMEKYSPY
ncbi:uncharacterized protein LOC142579528 isoform X2 [Dermacentor variabilis]|uniref:uncharacterized protein LOC142579528 isoform X2 n=1 Tax=Dermacentor variabilis TaxID=34621 RepID=UPI003F5B67F3